MKAPEVTCALWEEKLVYHRKMNMANILTAVCTLNFVPSLGYREMAEMGSPSGNSLSSRRDISARDCMGLTDFYRAMSLRR